MTKRPFFMLFLACATLMGCQGHVRDDEAILARDNKAYDQVRGSVSKESEAFARHQEALRQDLEKAGPPMPPIQPVAPTLDPLAEIPISISVDNMDVRQVLRDLAEGMGVNLTIHPDATREEKKISIHLKEVPASQALKEVLRQADLWGELKGNLLIIQQHQEKILDLDFLETTMNTTFEVGGDVLGSSSVGSGSSGGSSGGGDSLTGNFKISGEGAKKSNPYVIVQEMLDKVKTNEGNYHLNPLSGTLFIKDKPSVVANVEKILDRFGVMMRRQILLEARILEVELNDAHQFGVDWSLFRTLGGGNRAATVGTSNPNSLDLASFTSRQAASEFSAVDDMAAGNAMNYNLPSLTDAGNFPMQAIHFAQGWNAILTILQEFGDTRLLSNPSIRMRHGQPAMISVGLNNTYISKTTTSTTTSSTDNTSTPTTTVETGNVFDGLLLGVIPFIADDGRISLAIHPIQSNVIESSLALQETGGVNSPRISTPQVWLREISTSIDVKNGDTVVLGGLISKSRSENKRGLPGVAGIPILGGLLGGHQSESLSVSELVIVLRISVL